MPNYVTASGSNSFLDQLTHLRTQGIYQSGGVSDSESGGVSDSVCPKSFTTTSIMPLSCSFHASASIIPLSCRYLVSILELPCIYSISIMHASILRMSRQNPASIMSVSRSYPVFTRCDSSHILRIR